jgi:hypothetical protein
MRGPGRLLFSIHHFPDTFMSFLSPIWLVGLIPWTGLVLWMLRDRATVAAVPFTRLWPENAGASARRARRLPSVSVAAVLAAALLGILAAANPRCGFGGRSSNRFVVIVDRGLTMSAVNSRGQRRFVEAADSAAGAIGDAEITWQAVPESDANSPRDFQPTAVVDAEAIRFAAQQALRSSQGMVIVLSDQVLKLNDPRVIQISPESPVTNVGIEHFAVRAGAHPQAMVTIFNQSGGSKATLMIRCDGQEIRQDLDLPATGSKKNYFVDLPSSGNVVEAQVIAEDNLDLNHSAWAVRGSAWPKLEARAMLPPELNRMIEVYSRNRPADAGSKVVAVTISGDSNSPNVPTAILAEGGSPVHFTNQILVEDSPLTVGVDWRSALSVTPILPPPAQDWKPMVRVGELVAVAVQETPIRRVWVGFRSDDFARKPDFVIFWSNVFNWLAPGSIEYFSQAIGRLDGNWQLQGLPRVSLPRQDVGLVPGLYRGSDGSLIAVNASAPTIPPVINADWRRKLGDSMNVQSPRPIAGALLLAAIACVCLAAASWRTVPKS